MADQDTDEPVLQVRIAWPATSDLPMLFADSLLLTLRGDHYVLTVGQIDDPIVAPDDAAGLKKLKQKGSVSVRVLARYALTPLNFESFVVAASDLVSRVQAKEATP